MIQRFVAGLVLVGIAAFAQAQKPLQPAVPEPAAVDRDSSKDVSRENNRLKWRPSGTVAYGRGFASRPYPGSKSDAARAFLAEHASVGDASIVPVSETRLGNRTYVRFEQRIDGIPLRGAHAVVQLDAGNVVRAFQSRVEPSADKGGEWRLSSEEAIARTLQAHGAAASDTPSAQKEYLFRNGRPVPVWVVTFRSANPAGDWEYLIAADDGRVLGQQNLRRGNGALGFAYPRNPVRGGRERVRLENLSDDGSLTSLQTKVFTYFPALKAQVAPGTVVQGAAMRDGNFLYDSDDARSAEVQLYWGMETAGARFRALGFEGFAQPLRGVVFYQDWDPEAKRFTGADNAFFLANAFGEGRGGMFFYLTSRQGDTSLDTDVIFHEYTHAIVNEFAGPRQTAGFRALNEGTADYFSSSFLDDPVMAEYAAKLFNLRVPFLRRTDNEQSWPYNTVGEEHADGNIWSGALWDVRRALGATLADEIALHTVAFLSPDSEFFDAAGIAVLTAGELFGEEVAGTVAAIMERRGILTDGARTASAANWMEPGSAASGRIAASRPGHLLVGEQQYRIDVPHRATKLKVRLQSTGDARFYLRYRVPVTVEGGNVQAEQVSDTGTEASGYLSVGNTPELQAGTYYIAVANASTRPIDYNVDVQVDDYDPARAAPSYLEKRPRLGSGLTSTCGRFCGATAGEAIATQGGVTHDNNMGLSVCTARRCS